MIKIPRQFYPLCTKGKVLEFLCYLYRKSIVINNDCQAEIISQIPKKKLQNYCRSVLEQLGYKALSDEDLIYYERKRKMLGQNRAGARNHISSKQHTCPKFNNKNKQVDTISTHEMREFEKRQYIRLRNSFYKKDNPIETVSSVNAIPTPMGGQNKRK